ncbi:MAG: peroxiredoxin [Flavobacteriaceae bacterium]|nr:peroxiredoxin [Flavobacteriaceae bacterium]
MQKTLFNLLLFLLLIIATVNINAQKTKLKVGNKIPDFTLLNQYGDEFNSKDYYGKQSLVIFFYPKDNAPICTLQVISFRDSYSEFRELNAKVVGINPEYLMNHTEFSKANNLQYPILADKNNTVQKLFGVPWFSVSKRPKRYTFIVNKYGVIKHVYYNKKDAESHVTEALKALHKCCS